MKRPSLILVLRLMRIFTGTSKQEFLLKILVKQTIFSQSLYSQKSFSFDLLQSFPIIYSMWLYKLAFVLQQNMKKTFVLQKKCERLLTFSDFCEPTNPIFKSLKILKLLAVLLKLLKLSSKTKRFYPIQSYLKSYYLVLF